jgi:hypothetical protein
MNIFPPPSQSEETWQEASSIRSALEEVWDNHMPMATSFPARLDGGTWDELNYSSRSIELTEARRRNAASEELLYQRGLHIEHILRETKLDLHDYEQMSNCSYY